MSPEEFDRFQEIRKYLVDNIDVAFSKNPKDMALANEFRRLRDKWLAGPVEAGNKKIN